MNLKKLRLNLSRLLMAISLLLWSLLASGQGDTQPRPLRYVSEWEVPRVGWAEFEAFADHNIRPLLESQMSKGSVLSWGIYRSMLIQDGASTHGIWFEAPTISRIENVLDELSRLPSPSVSTTAKHHDFLYRAQLRRARSGNGTGGYLFVNTTQIQPGKRQDWRDWWDKHQKPNFEQYLAEGLVTEYELVGEEIHHAGPNWVYLIYVTPSAEALDKLDATFVANTTKRTAEENRAINEALDTTVVPSGHQDYIARALAYSQR
jgi:hypothetical protein